MSTKTFGPYSPVRQVAEWLFVSGQVGVNPVTGVAEKDVAGQTKQALTNLQTRLKDHDADLSHVVKTTVFLKNIDDFAAVNDVYGGFFSDPYPARSCVEVARLPKVSADGTELLVEVEAVLYKGEAQ